MCGTCLYARPARPNENQLTCHRNAPVVRVTMTEAVGTAWPRVLAEDWCGEYQPVSVPQAAERKSRGRAPSDATS